MSKLDDIKSTVKIDDELYYGVQLMVEGEWVVMSAMTKEQVIRVAKYIDEVVV
jgi:hypothetical protein